MGSVDENVPSVPQGGLFLRSVRLGVAVVRQSPSTVMTVLLAILLIGSVMAIGAVHPPVMGAAAVVSGAAACFALSSRGQHPSPFPKPALIFFCLAAYCALQAMPIPSGVLLSLAPENADIWSRVLEPVGEKGPAWTSISLDPGASLIEALRWLSYGAAFIAAATLAYHRNARGGFILVFLAALVAALTTLVHGLVGAERVFGIYEPSFVPQPWHIGPLLNPNNLSGYLNLGAMCGLGLLLMRKPPLPAWSIGIGVAVIMGVNVTAASRGGVALLLLGTIVLAVVVERSRSRRAQSRPAAGRARLIMAAVLAFGVLLAVLGGTPKVWAELYDENLEKLGMVWWVKPMLMDHEWWGIGRGAFESVFPSYQQGLGRVVYTHAENFIAQWLVEWGIPVTMLALISFAWHFRAGRMGVGRNAANAGAWLGVLVLVLHNLVDLGLEIPAVCFAIVVVLGSLWGDAQRVELPATTLSDNVPLRPWLPAALIAVSMTVLFAFVDRMGWHSLASDRQRLGDAMAVGPSDRSIEKRKLLRQDIRSCMLRHPAESYFPLLGALLAWQEGDQDVMPWLQRALERSLVNGKAHLLLARVLVAHGARDQALLETRLAAKHDPTLGALAARLAARLVKNLEQVRTAVERGSDGVKALDALAAELNRIGKVDLALLADREALARDPKAVSAHIRLAQSIIGQREKGERCAGKASCQQQIEVHLKAIAAERPESSIDARLRARWLVAEERIDEAETLLATRCEAVSDVVACLQLRTRIAAQSKDDERLAEVSKQLFSAACMDPKRCAELSEWVGDLHRQRRQWGAAIANYRRAIRDRPTADCWAKLGHAALSASLAAEAIQAYKQALRLGADPSLKERLQRAEAQLRQRLTDTP